VKEKASDRKVRGLPFFTEDTPMFNLLEVLGTALLAPIAALTGGGRPSRHISPPVAIYYRTQDGMCDYAFSIEEQSNGQYRSYIVWQPDYGNRSTDALSTHRHTGSGGRSYVCWSKPIYSPEDALRVSAAWADATQQYIKSGQRF
jgi:hypothetical protein